MIKAYLKKQLKEKNSEEKLGTAISSQLAEVAMKHWS